MSSTYKIYGLYDPRRPEVVMCVGKTRQHRLTYRLTSYVAEARRGRNIKSLHWVRALLSDGVRPKIRLLATTTVRNHKKCERRFITIWKKRNPQLLNVLGGGDGQDDGRPKLSCDKCGTKRMRQPSGFRYCPKCRSAWDRKWRKKWRRLASQPSPQTISKRREWQKAYRSKERYKERERAHSRLRRRTKKYRKYQREYFRKWRRLPEQRKKKTAYNLDWRHARKAGLTIAAYRESKALKPDAPCARL